MADEERTAEDESDAEGPSVNAFLAMMQSEADQRRESSQAFSQELSRQPDVEELLEDQQRQQEQLAEIERKLGRLRRSVVIASVCSASLLIAFLALLGYFVYLNNESGFALGGNPEADSAVGANSPNDKDVTSDLAFATDPEFAIRNDVDREYQRVVRQLYSTMRTIREPNHRDVEVRNAEREHYVWFIADVLRVIEKSAKDQPSEEILTALINIATVGQHLRREEGIWKLSPEMQERHYQIKSVLRARDARLENTEL